jgi:Tol biopolymer transport system component
MLYPQTRLTSRVLLLVAALLASVATAHASYPGKNGRIVFVEGPDIWTVNPDGSDARQLTSFGSSGKAACCASWSADGKTLVFAAIDSSTDPMQIWMMNADGSNRNKVLNDPEFNDNDPSLSPDGTTIAFERCPLNSGGCELFQMQVDGTGMKALIPFSRNTDIFDVTPVYSPDGKTIAFSGFNRSGLIAAIFLMDANGGHIRPITPPGLEAFLPDWSPDGNTIAFTTRAGYPPNTLNQQVWIMNKDGSGLRQFTFPGSSHDFSPAWSPQDDAIVFERDNADFSQFVIFVKSLTSSSSLEQALRQGKSAEPVKREPLRLTITGRAPQHGTVAKRVIENGAIPRWGPAPE